MKLYKTEYPLQTIYLYLTDYCNLKCRHCWIEPKSFNKNNLKGYINYEELKKCIKEAKEIGLKSVKLTGGRAFFIS